MDQGHGDTQVFKFLIVHTATKKACTIITLKFLIIHNKDKDKGHPYTYKLSNSYKVTKLQRNNNNNIMSSGPMSTAGARLSLREASHVTEHDAVLPGGRLSQNDDANMVLRRDESDFLFLQNAYKSTLRQVQHASERASQPQSTQSTKEAIVPLRNKADAIYNKMSQKLDNSSMSLGRSMASIPHVDDLLSGQAQWDDWQPEHISMAEKAQIQTHAPKQPKPVVKASSSVNADDADLLDFVAPVYAKPANKKTSGFASRFGKPASVIASSSSSSSGNEVQPTQQIPRETFPTPAITNNHFSLNTIAEVERTKYDTSKDQNVEQGQSKQQSPVGVMVATAVNNFVSKMMGGSDDRMQSSSRFGVRKMFGRVCGRV